MKQTTTYVLALMIAVGIACGFESCTKEKTAAPTNTTAAANALKCGHPTHPTPPPVTPDCGTATVAPLKAGNTTVGSVTVSNNATSLKVTYTTTGGWSLDEMSLYVGDIANIPRRNGAVNAASFSRQANPSYSVQTYTFTIPLTSVPNCFSIAAEARVVRSRCTAEVAWGAGTTITVSHTSTCGGHNCCNNYYNCNNNDATYFSYCEQACTTPTCILTPSILFSGESEWPNGVNSVVVGGFTYTHSDITNEYLSPTNDAQQALLLIATLKIYGSTITVPASVSADATVVENWLRTLGQLNTYSNFTAPSNVATSLNNLNTWIASQVCQ